MDVVPLLGAIVGCHCSGWLGRVTTNFGGVDVVPLLGAIVGCHCRVLWWGEGDGQLWRSGRGAIAGCHCSVLWLGEGDDQLWGSCRVPLQGASVVGRVTTNFGEWTWCHCWMPL